MTSALVVAAAIVLAVAGVAKLSRPGPAVDALHQAGLPGSTTLVSAMGVGELVLGAVVVVWEPRIAVALLALGYLGFAIFAARLLTKRGRSVSCGCFGFVEAPVHPLHVAVNLVVAVAAGLVAADVPQGQANPFAVVGFVVLLLVGLLVAPRFAKS